MPVDLKNIPQTIEQAVNYIVSSLNDEEIEYTKQNPSASLHFSTGMNIRNSWGLWTNTSPLKLDAVKTYGIAHADDISGLILSWVKAKVNNEEFDPQQYCKRYHAHWNNNYGMTSLEAGGWNNELPQSS